MYDITIQSPYERNPVVHPNRNAESARDLYYKIDWYGLYEAIKATGSSPETSFYFYEIAGVINAEKIILTISGYIEDTVCINFMRPKMVTKGFFKKKQVLDLKFDTTMEAVSIPFGNTCFEAFLKGDLPSLERDIIEQRDDLF